MMSNLYGLVLRSFQIKSRQKSIKLFFQYFVYDIFLVIQFMLSKFPLKETCKGLQNVNKMKTGHNDTISSVTSHRNLSNSLC